VQLIDLKKPFAPIMTATCNPTFDVVGTTNAGDIVVELDSANACGADGHDMSFFEQTNPVEGW